VLLEKKKESKTGMEIMNLLQKEGKQRGTWLNKKADGDFYKMIVSSYHQYSTYFRFFLVDQII
jgi:X breakpoint 2-interacting protein